MRRGLRAMLIALVAVAIVGGQIAPAHADDEEQRRLEQLAREKEELEHAVQVSRQNAERHKKAASQFQAAVNAATTRINRLSVQQAEAQNAADVLKVEIEIAEEQLSIAAFQVTETQSLIDSLNAQADEQTRHLKRREDLYGMHLRTTYMHAQVSPLEMLLSSSSLSDFAARVQALILINRQDRQLVGEMRALRELTAQKRSEVAVREQEIFGLRWQIQTQKASLAEKKAEYEDLVRAVQASIDEQDVERNNSAADRDQARDEQSEAKGETARLNKQLEATEAAYAQLAAELAARSGLGAFNGRMAIWPVNGPITSRYGPRRGGFHNGIDLAGPRYTAIRASAAGQIVTVGRPYVAYGDTAVVVIIAHGSNFSSLYGHLDDSRWPPVHVGQFVAAGTVIGYIGMTGWTTGPHVHFMTIVNGRAVDPLQYMPR